MAPPIAIIVTALLHRDGEILLVEQQGPEDVASSWMLPGGRVEEGETLPGALERELAEETGLTLTDAPRIAFLVELLTPAGSYSAITFDCDAGGTLAPNDPDGLVLSAAWVDQADAIGRLSAVEWYDCVPLERYLSGEAAPGAVYRMDRR